jgi:hypothetical protein
MQVSSICVILLGSGSFLAADKNYLCLPVQTYEVEALANVWAADANLKLDAAFLDVSRYGDKEVKARRIDHLRSAQIQMKLLPERIFSFVLIQDVQYLLTDFLYVRTEDIPADNQGDFLT